MYACEGTDKVSIYIQEAEALLERLGFRNYTRDQAIAVAQMIQAENMRSTKK